LITQLTVFSVGGFQVLLGKDNKLN
jgi:hypothetical protein